MPKKKKGVHKTIKIRIRTEVLTKKKKKRLKQITARDTRIIKAYLKIIKHKQDALLIKRKGQWKVKKGDLDLLTLTTRKRKTVPHDLKKRFRRCSHDEFQECRDTACWIVESWKALEETTGKEQGFPTITGQVPRAQSPNRKRFRLETVQYNTLARSWVGIRDSLDTNRKGKRVHDRLWLPLSCNPYHDYQLRKGEIKTLELCYDPSTKEWWGHFTINVTVPSDNRTSTRPPAVLGVDLGVNTRAVSALVTPKQQITRHEIKFWSDNERMKQLRYFERRIGRAQQALHEKLRTGQKVRNILHRLDVLYHRRDAILYDGTRRFVNKLVHYILSLDRRYEVQVVVGYPYNIRHAHYRGNFFKYGRKIVHQWNYREVVYLLKWKLALQGWKDHRVLAISESYTSKKCSRCGSMKTTRPAQAHFHCKTCGYTLHADLNGARNIVRRFIGYLTDPKYSTIKDLHAQTYFNITLYRSFTVLGQWSQYQTGTGPSP